MAARQTTPSVTTDCIRCILRIHASPAKNCPEPGLPWPDFHLRFRKPPEFLALRLFLRARPTPRSRTAWTIASEAQAGRCSLVLVLREVVHPRSFSNFDVYAVRCTRYRSLRVNSCSVTAVDGLPANCLSYSLRCDFVPPRFQRNSRVTAS